MGLSGIVEATIEDLDITTRSSRESDAVRQRCCIEHDFAKGRRLGASAGTEERVKKIGANMHSSKLPRRAVRNGVKNLHGSEAIPESRYKVFCCHGNKDATFQISGLDPSMRECVINRQGFR